MSNDDPVLPEQTKDDTDAGWGDPPDGDDDHYLDELPPHHVDRD